MAVMTLNVRENATKMLKRDKGIACDISTALALCAG
jgi:hypothetical protein